MSHKKNVLLYFGFFSVLLDDFVYFRHQWKQEWIFYNLLTYCWRRHNRSHSEHWWTLDLVTTWKDLEQHVIETSLTACVSAKGGHFEHTL